MRLKCKVAQETINVCADGSRRPPRGPTNRTPPYLGIFRNCDELLGGTPFGCHIMRFLRDKMKVNVCIL